MSDPRVTQFVQALRRAAGYVRLYGSTHALAVQAIEEAASAATTLAAGRAGILLGVVDDTLFADGEPCGLLSLQHNAFLREITDAGVQTVMMTGRVDPADLGALVRLIAGEIHEFPECRTIRLNTIVLAEAGEDHSPVAGLRRSYTRSLDALRGFGGAMQEKRASSLDETAAAVKDLLEKSLSNPAAALLLTTVKSHHEYTFYHSVNTSILSLGIARLVGLPERDQVVLGIGAMLHDIGKIGVSSSILQQPGRLDDEQWAQVRRHPQMGAEAILAAAAPGEELAAAVALEHHARYDGTGYPRLVYHDGTRHPGHGHPLHFFSRLVAVADTYDALTTRRSYRRADPPSRALQILVNEAGTSYDPDFVVTFASMMGVYPPGSFLQLATGEVVMVTQPSGDPADVPEAILVRDRTGADVGVPEPVPYRAEDVVDQLPGPSLGLQPVTILEKTARHS